MRRKLRRKYTLRRLASSNIQFILQTESTFTKEFPLLKENANTYLWIIYWWPIEDDIVQLLFTGIYNETEVMQLKIIHRDRIWCRRCVIFRQKLDLFLESHVQVDENLLRPSQFKMSSLNNNATSSDSVKVLGKGERFCEIIFYWIT